MPIHDTTIQSTASMWEILWFAANLLGLCVQLYSLKSLVHKFVRRRRAGKNGALSLLIIKKLVLSVLFVTWSTVFTLMGVAYMLVDNGERDAEALTRLRAVMAIALVMWAASVMLYGFADIYLQGKVEQELDKHSGNSERSMNT